MGRAILLFFGTFVVSGFTVYFALSLLFPPEYVTEQDSVGWQEDVKEMENETDVMRKEIE